MSHEGPAKPINWESINELADADGATILAMLEATPTADVTLSEEHLEEIRNIAMGIGATTEEKKTAQELFALAYEKYVTSAGQAGAEAIRSMSDTDLRAYVLEDTGHTMTDDEIAAFRKSDLDVDEWFEQRGAMEPVAPFSVAVDETGNVVAQGTNEADVTQRAHKEIDADSWREGLK